MSWVHHHKKPPPPSSSSSLSSSFHSLQPSININSTINSNSQQQQLQNRNPPSVLRQATSSVSQPLTASSPLLMTSQYSNKTTTNSSLKSTITTPTAVSTTMHLNQSPYQPMTQQQSQQQHQQQQQHVQSLTPQQRHQQHVLQTTSSQPPPPQTPTPTLNSTSQLQGVFNTNQQQNSWPTQSQNFLPSSKMMQPTPPPPAAAQTAAMNNNNNNWPQQPVQQPLQQNYQNANMYPQQNTNLQQQQWPQQNIQQQQQPPSTTYDNSYYQQHANANNNNMYQQQPPPPPSQHVAQQNPATYFQQQQHVVQNQAPPANTNPVNFFDNSNNNQSSGDGWGDWDWNDNSAIAPPPEQKVANEPQMTTQQQQHVANDNLQHQQQHGQFNTSVIADSFSNPTNNNNDNWSWGAQGNEQQQQPQQVASANKIEPQKLDNNVKPQNDNWNWSSGGNDQQQQQQQPPPPQIPDVNVPNNDNWNWQASNENQQQIAATQNVADVNASKVAPPKTLENLNAIENPNQIASPPPPPPPTEFSSSTAASENHNYNTNAVSSPSNIPNTVFVTQAKPVSLPARQFASPPSGNTPVTENPPETTLMPPQGFQNVEESITRPANVVSPAIPPPAIPPPAAGLPPTATAAANPFKRSGVAQHHRATGLMTTTSTTASAASPAIPVVFNMPPPPPADFANPGSVTLMEPENNELPSQENQEVLSPPPPTSNITLPNTNVVMTAPPSNISLPNATTSTQPPPPNDERNQYLQTSHLSENSEEQQPEADGLLPPPGLSRLVLGEPELEASQQRMVMGTEASTVNNTANQAAAMHLEERHADGEDTASENAVPILNNSGSGVPPSSSTLSSDRNLYLVPGESNNNNVNTNQPQQQRVVTGVELAEQREIEMDGENLEDEQIQQQQQQHQQQLQQLQHQSLSAEGRNEPPVEGADEIIEQPTLASSGFNHPTDQHVEQHHHNANNQTIKTKDSHAISSPNDDDDSDERLLNDRAMTQSTAGSSKSRSKYENDRIAAASSRRREKRSSVQRYESDEYLNSEGEYSSDREERERRERDRRRNYREGSVRSERGGPVDEDEKRSRRNRNSDKRDKYYYEGEERNRGERGGERERGGDQQQRSKNDRRSQRQRGYDMDSRYETEESTRFDNRKDPARRSMRHPEADRNRRGDRSDQGADYDDYNRRGYRSSKRSGENYEADRRDRRRSDKLRDPRYRDDPRYDPREFEDYRKHSSRNARESDYEKDGAGPAGRAGRMPHDPRQTAAAAMYGYPSGGYYDPYTAYYYQQMARNNPQAYAEWYKKYYGSTAAHAAGVAQGTGMQGAPNAAHADASLSNAVNDGRESVHSGRSSAHNDMKDRYTHAYITQANDYHRHYQQQQQQQHHHHQQQQQHHQQMAFNQSLNSTMLDEDSLNNHNNSLYGGVIGGVLSSARSNTNLSQIHGGYYMMPTSGTITSAASVYYARSDYAESRSGAISMRDPDPIANEPQRLTPCKFINEHAVVSFSSGVLVTVKPKYTPNGSISNVVKLLKFKPNDETRKLFKVFPGPLVRGLTHKKTVIEFCHEQIRLGPMETTIYAKQLITNNADKYRGSYTLMWNLLILLLKQNGMVVGTDIAELLLKNEQQFPYQTPNSSLNNSLKSKSGSNSPAEELQDSQKDSHDTAADTHNKSDNSDNAVVVEDKEKLDDDDNEDNSLTKSSSVSSPLTEDEITEKFRNYLLYGNVNEALEWATDNNLWGHALFLASKLDRRSHANVMMKFANKLSLNDPLQTLYQLMSGRTPSSVTCIQDEKWGDWRPHLSMILSNTSQKPELDRKSITTLGDSLFNRGDLYAAHFCYLMAQVSFGRYQETATLESTLQQHLPKLVLLGSSHYKQFQDFSHNEAIIMTEIYEYARSLNDDKFSIVEFQPYKFLLASRLLDYGFHLKSLMYLEQIAVHIARDSSKYESSFINKVYDMADRLKYYDPVLEKTIDDQQQLPGSEDINGSNSPFQQMEEQKWLQNLRELAQQYKTELSSSITAATSTNSIQDAQQQQQQQTIDPNYNYQQQQIDQQFMEINKQFSELNLQYQPQNTGNEQPVFYNTEQQHQQQQQQPTITHTVEDQPQSLDPYHLNQQQQQPQQSLQPELPITNAKDLQQPELLQPPPPPTSMSDANQDTYQQQYLQPDMQQQQSGYTQNYYDPSQQQQQQQYNAVDGSSGGIDSQQQPASYDYWGQQQQQHMPQLGEENARPTISMPKSKTYDTDDDGKQQLGNDAKKQQQQQSQQKGAKKEDKDANKGSLQQSNQNSGWFGGIWNKFSLKPKNQMILPDDKNPSIVWDPEKKKWVNVDGEEAEQESFKPPPKMSDIMPQPPVQPQIPNVGQISLQQQQQQQPQPTNQIPFMDPQQMPQQQQQQQYVPSSMPTSAPSPNPMQQQPQQQPQNQPQQAAATAKTPNLQSNMFKMQRNRTLKNAYVDVFNPSGAPVNKAAEGILAPALPPAAVPQGGFFVPGGGQEQQYQQQPQQQQSQQQDTPHFYNPNQFTAGSGY